MDPQIARLIKDPVLRHGEALTIGYLVALRGYDRPVEMDRVNEEDFERGLALGEQARKEGPVPFFLGYYPNEDLPIKKDQTITLPAGTRVTYKGVVKVSTKARKVRVNHILSGSNYYIRKDHHREDVHPITAPKVRWAGSGGYWSEVDINDVPEAVEAAKEARREAARQSQSALIEIRIQQLAEVLDRIRTDLLSDGDPKRWPFREEGFSVRMISDKSYLQVDAVADDAVIASFTIDTYVESGKIVLHTNITSSICQHLSSARVTFRALGLLMAQAEYVDLTYGQPWNQS